MADESPPITTFVVTDIEADGPSPLGSSMLSFASVACDVTGKVLDAAGNTVKSDTVVCRVKRR